MTKKSKENGPAPGRRIENIRREIAAMDLVARGTLSKRTKVCGKAGCRCAKDPTARHGPYYEWTRREKGRFAHTVISAERAGELAAAIDNYKRILTLLERWSNETSRVLKMKSGRK